jgi:hypothetical protein
MTVIPESKFRRQHPLGRFIVDFYCAWLESHGYSVIRFENKAVIEDLGIVIKKTVRLCQRLEGAGQAKNPEIEGGLMDSVEKQAYLCRRSFPIWEVGNQRNLGIIYK